MNPSPITDTLVQLLHRLLPATDPGHHSAAAVAQRGAPCYGRNCANNAGAAGLGKRVEYGCHHAMSCPASPQADAGAGDYSSRAPRPYRPAPYHIPDTQALVIDSEGEEMRRLSQPHAAAHPSTGFSLRTPSPGFPGKVLFRPGLSNVWILLLRLRLITHGYGEGQREALLKDPDFSVACAWNDELRAACMTFQLAQGWRGADAAGYPTEETWRRLWK